MADSSGSPVVKKSKRATVTDITSRGGRPGGRGYDPLAGEEIEPEVPEPVEQRGSKAEFDVFSLVDSSSYRHDRFYTRSVDRHHHGESMRVRVPQGIDSQMFAAVNEVPHYRHVNDLIRDAVIHRLEWLQHHYDLDDSVRRMCELERYNADTERQAQEIEQMQTAVLNLDGHLERCFQAQDWQMLALGLVEGDELAEWLREPYQTQALQVLAKWRHQANTQLTKLRDRTDR